MPPGLYVVIPTTRRADLLRRTLHALSKCVIPASYEYTLVVENGPQGKDVVADVESSRPELRTKYLHVERANKSHALNRAMEVVGDGLVVFFDDDVVPVRGALQAYAAAAGVRREGAFFGGPVAPDFEEAPPAWLLEYLPDSARGWAAHDGDEVTPDRFLGLNWAAFSADIRRAGGFDPRFGPGAETGSTGQETDMQVRMLRRGVEPVYVEGARVSHYVPRSRCTPEWALRRAVRDGIYKGLKSTLEPTLLGYPAPMIRELAMRGAKAGVKAVMGRERRFAGWWWVLFQWGVLKGYRLRQADRGRPA